MAEPKKAGLFRYVKEAFLFRWNLLLLAGAGAAAILIGHPDIALPLVAAAEVTYLAGLATLPRFQSAIDAKVRAEERGLGQPSQLGAGASDAQSATTGRERIMEVLKSLAEDRRGRFLRLRARCVEMSRIANAVRGDRTVTLIGFEGDYAVRYTKVTGEFVRDSFAIPGLDAAAYAWFIQATQTISPRWSIGGRHEGTDAPIAGTGAIFRAQPRLLANELTARYRLTREITLKASYYARQPYGRLTWDQQGGVQIVWQKRWW
jgi:hypothetical protein